MKIPKEKAQEILDTITPLRARYHVTGEQMRDSTDALVRVVREQLLEQIVDRIRQDGDELPIEQFQTSESFEGSSIIGVNLYLVDLPKLHKILKEMIEHESLY